MVSMGVVSGGGSATMLALLLKMSTRRLWLGSLGRAGGLTPEIPVNFENQTILHNFAPLQIQNFAKFRHTFQYFVRISAKIITFNKFHRILHRF